MTKSMTIISHKKKILSLPRFGTLSIVTKQKTTTIEIFLRKKWKLTYTHLYDICIVRPGNNGKNKSNRNKFQYFKAKRSRWSETHWITYSREKKRDLFFVNWIFDSSEKRKKPNTGRINKEGVANNTYGT